MTPERFAEIIAGHGVAVTLRRPTSSSTFSDVTTVGKPIGGRGQDIAGAVSQTVLDLKLARTPLVAAGWAEPPRENDRVVVLGKTRVVESVAALEKGGTVYGWRLGLKG